MGAIRWHKTPLAKIKDSGIYAKSEDGRFLVFARRYRHGQPGDRKYTYFFSAVDYHTPSGGKRYTNVPVPGAGADQESVNPEKVFAAVEKWLIEHPSEPKSDDKLASRVAVNFLSSTQEWDDHEYDE